MCLRSCPFVVGSGPFGCGLAALRCARPPTQMSYWRAHCIRALRDNMRSGTKTGPTSHLDCGAAICLVPQHGIVESSHGRRSEPRQRLSIRHSTYRRAVVCAATTILELENHKLNRPNHLTAQRGDASSRPPVSGSLSEQTLQVDYETSFYKFDPCGKFIAAVCR